MLRLAGGFGAILALAAGVAEAQTTGTRDALLINHWVCSARDGSLEYGQVLAQFEADRRLMVKFYDAQDDFKSSLSIYGTWKYNPSTDSYSSEIFSSARLGDMTVSGKPMSREEFPGGETAVQKLEQDFLEQSSTSPLNVTTLTATKLVMADSGDLHIDCSH